MRSERSTWKTSLAAALGGWVLLSTAVAAQQDRQTATGDDEIGTHVVRPGETLQGITAYYLGTSERWEENWRLNPDIGDPHTILPGKKLRVLVPSRLPEASARLIQVNRTVEEQRPPSVPTWAKAQKNDLLKSRDGLRTDRGSSAEVLFPDDNLLLLTEQSFIVLGQQESARPQAPSRQEIQIDYGQADLEGRSRSAAAAEIVIVMGDATVTPRASEDEPIRARTRLPRREGDAPQQAQLMVYSGSSDVEAAGERIEVPQGMGTTMREGEAPKPPEKLLDAPRLLTPAVDARFEIPNPVFEWAPVDGANDYTLEVCRDERCALLVKRVDGLRLNRWRPPVPQPPRPGEPPRHLENGSYFWRVTARSPSGLDGFPSAAAAFAILGQEVDETPPKARLWFAGPRLWVGERRVLGIGTHIEGEAVDEGIGLEMWTPLLDGVEVGPDDWRSPWTPGPHTASIRAVDRAGNEWRLEPEPFYYDPQPPLLRWGLEDGGDLGETSGEEPLPGGLEVRQPSPFATFWSRVTGSDQSPLLWSSSRLRWLPMTWADWNIGSDKPYVVIRARKKPVTFTDLGVTVTRDRGMWIHAVDEGCGVEHMSYQLLVDPEGHNVLTIEITDALDNLTRVAWKLEHESEP